MQRIKNTRIYSSYILVISRAQKTTYSKPVLKVTSSRYAGNQCRMLHTDVILKRIKSRQINLEFDATKK